MEFMSLLQRELKENTREVPSGLQSGQFHFAFVDEIVKGADFLSS